MNVFSNLLYLYGKNGAVKTPTEDFCTECLAGVLNSDQDLLNKFVMEVLNIQAEENFTVLTQETHHSFNGLRGIVDMVFISTSWICFLEMKVDASEGEQQLETYNQLLNESQKINKKHKALRYCTKYKDQKEFDFNQNFEQFRWADIAKYLSKYSESNELVNEFYQFLKEKKMAGNERFTFEDILGMKAYGDVTLKMEEILEKVNSDLEDKFKRGSINTGIGEIRDYNRIALRCNDIIANGHSGIVLAFKFNGSLISDGPIIFAQLWVNHKNNQFRKFKDEASKKYPDGNYKEDKNGSSAYIKFEKPLADYLEKEDQFKQIEEWYKDKIEIFHDYKNNSELKWN